MTAAVLTALPSAGQGQVAGLVAAYSFDEGAGTSVSDASGSGNTGSIGAATWTGQGRFGGALAFNGSNARVTVPDSPTLRLTSAMTLEAWVNPTTINGTTWRDVVYKGNDNYYLSATSYPNGRPVGGGIFSGSYGEAYGSSNLPLNTWSHLATTYDGQTIRLYVNGSQVASLPKTGTLAQSSNPLQIGGDDIWGQHFAGRIDEVRVYAAALSQAQIQTDMGTAIGGGTQDTSPPTVSITAPSSGATASHVTTITANASDDTAVLSVQFFANGVSLGTDFTAPYALDWNTTATSNGARTLTAVATDGAGNQATSSPVNVTVTNPAFVNEVVVPDIADATTIAFLPDGRLLIGRLSGTLLVVQPGASQPDAAPFLTLDNSHLQGEQGVYDIVADPGFAQNGWYYVFYTKGFAGQQNRDRVSRFTASGNGTVAGSEVVLWEDDRVAATDHHGATIVFGQDGRLYVSVGDHLIGSDAQSLANFHGKILRINKDGTVPTDNPFFDGGGPNRDAIWAYGLRNPFRISVDSVTGRMYIADVGGNDDGTAIEEVNLGTAGANYGWPMCEGPCPVQGTTGPIYSYSHDNRDASITGGFVYRGSQFPSEYHGSYFFGDYAQNTLRRLRLAENGDVLGASNFWPASGALDTSSVGDPVKLLEGPDGSLYYVDIGFTEDYVPNASAIRRIRYTIGNQPPTAVASATPTTGQAPLTVQFSSAGSADPEGAPLSYSWTFGDGATSTAPNPSHTYAASGSYTARLTVSDGATSTLSSGIAISVGSPPVPTISAPADGSLFRAGDAVAFAGDASDPEDGTLPASAFSWTFLFHHDSHIHPAGGTSGTKSGQFPIPTSGHDFQGSTSYDLILTVTDSTGLSASTSVTIVPDKVNLAFDTVPSGLELEVDGIRKRAPFVLDEVKGFRHTINAPAQTSGGTSYAFSSWSDGGAASHTLVVPDVDTSYTATFQPAAGPAPVAAYSFDEGTGTSVTDASGNGNTGNIGAAAWTGQGRFGGALSFNGTNARVTVPDSPTLRLTGAMTLEAWVNPTTISGTWRDVVYKGNDNYYLSASSYPNGRPVGGGIFSGSHGEAYGSSNLALNTWTHLATTYDGQALRLYVNGSQVASLPETGTLAQSSNPLQIGGDDIWGQHFAGRIDEVRVYNAALTQAQIQADMGTGIGGGSPPSDTQPPSAPTALDATATSPTQINLSWTAATDNVAVLRYRIERCEGAGCTTFTEIATTTETTYADGGRTPSTSYSYRVRAQDTATNDGPYSTTATAQTPAPPAPKRLYFSLLSNGTVGGVSVANEDVVLFDGVATFSLVFDGSDVGLSARRLDAFTWLDADTLLFSLDTDGAVLPGVAETIDDSDVVRFDATSLGATTSGTFTMYLDGSDVGLTTAGEDVDAVELLTNGNLLLSTEGSVGVPGVSGDDEDLLAFTPGSLGSTTSGAFAIYFDGSDVGLTTSGEDVDAAAVDAAGRIYLSALNGFSVAGVSGADEDVFVFDPSTLGTTTTGSFDSNLYFDGSGFGLDANDVFAIDLPPDA